jgi:hypothetical protein
MSGYMVIGASPIKVLEARRVDGGGVKSREG